MIYLSKKTKMACYLMLYSCNIYINEQQNIFNDVVNDLKFQKLDKKKAIGSESDTKNGAGQARKLRKRCSNLNMLYCICDLYEFEKLAKNRGIPTPFFFFFVIIYVMDMTSSICQFRLHHFCNSVGYGYVSLFIKVKAA